MKKQEKVADYYPTAVGNDYKIGCFEISLKSSEESPEWTIRKVKKNKNMNE